MRKTFMIASIFLILAFMTSMAYPTLGEITSGTTNISIISERPNPPPGAIDLTINDSKPQPEPDFANPRVYDNSVFWLGDYQVSLSGSYATFHPQTIHLETDWFTDTQEYWVQTSVVKTDEYKAEVGLDVKYQFFYYIGWYWTVDAYAAVSEDPNGYSYVIAWHHVSTSTVAPSSATVGVYEKNGGVTWAWVVNGVEFATHNYPERWAGYYTHVATEAYNQPVAGTGGQYISIVDGIYTKRSSDGIWSSAIYYASAPENGVFNGWMVDVYAENGYRRDWSTRY